MHRILKRFAAGIAAAVMLLGSSPNIAVHADTGHTLNISYHGESADTKIDGATFSVVKAAGKTADGLYAMTDTFKDSGIDPNNLGEDVRAAAKTLESVYENAGTKPEVLAIVTGSDGTGSLTITEAGLYLVWQTGSTGTASSYNVSDPMLVFLPTYDSDAGAWKNSVTIEPKTSKIPETPKEENPPSKEEEHSGGGTGAISVYKVDADNNDVYLQGAVFSLYKSDGTKVGTYTTNEKGYFGVSYLTYGSYYLLEDKAPDGYVGGTDKIYFTLNSSTSYSNKYPWNIKVTNTKSTAPAPTPEPDTPTPDTPEPTTPIQKVINRATGDASNIPLYAGLLVIAVAGLGGALIYKKKHS